MSTFSLEPARETLHGHFSRDLAPVLTIDPGDTVRFRTLDAGWNLEPRRSVAHEDHPRKFEPRDPEKDNGHALCGPVAVRGARPGMTLGVRVDCLRPGTWGWTAAGGWSNAVNDRLGVSTEGTFLLWTLDPETMTGRDQHGHAVALRPFLGVMGLAPAEPGRHPTAPPRACACSRSCAGMTMPLATAFRTPMVTCSGSVPASATSNSVRAASVRGTPWRHTISSRHGGCRLVCSATSGGAV